MTAQRKNRIRALLKGIETGDPAAVAGRQPRQVHSAQPPDSRRERGPGGAVQAAVKELSPRQYRASLLGR